MGELMQSESPYYYELHFFTVHFVIAVYLAHAIFNPLQSCKRKYMNCSKNESESKKSCAHSSEWPSCLCIIGMETSPGIIDVLTQPKHIVKEYQFGGHKQEAGGPDAARGLPIEDCCYVIWCGNLWL